eukprot:3193580-Pleurochrysis_carterae.AAC.1
MAVDRARYSLSSEMRGKASMYLKLAFPDPIETRSKEGLLGSRAHDAEPIRLSPPVRAKSRSSLSCVHSLSRHLTSMHVIVQATIRYIALALSGCAARDDLRAEVELSDAAACRETSPATTLLFESSAWPSEEADDLKDAAPFVPRRSRRS